LARAATVGTGALAGGLWRCSCVVVQEARQEPDQLVAFGLGQWREQVVLDGGDAFVEPSQVAAAVREHSAEPGKLSQV